VTEVHNLAIASKIVYYLSWYQLTDDPRKGKVRI